MAQSYDRRINLYINGVEVKNNISSIRKEMYKLTNEQALMTRGSREYYAQADKIKQLKGIMAQHVKDVNNVQTSTSKLVGIARQFLPALSIATVVAGVGRMVKSFAKLDDKLADVQKTTGLTRVGVSQLNQELQKIDTRSSQEELLDLARVAGKLGITGADNILGFVRAADKIKIALSEDLGGDVEESINQLGKIVDIFKLTDKFGVEDALLKVGSAINSLGAAGTANEGYMVEFAKRVAGIAPAAKISIEDILGLAATLDELGQTSEVSGTAYVQVIGKMFKETETYAGIAKMAVQDFTNLLNTDANEAFIKVLEGAKGSGEGFSVMAKNLESLGLDGARSTAVLGTLAENIDKLREKQAFSSAEFEKGTSILVEFATKNETLQAGLEKLGKWFSNQFNNIIEGINAGLRTQTSLFAEQVTQFAAAQQNLVPLIQEYENLKQKSELSADEQARMKTIIGDIANITPFAISQMDEYGNAIDISTEKAREWIDAQKIFLQYQNAEAIKDTEKQLERINSKLEKQNQLKEHLVYSAQEEFRLGYSTVNFYDKRIAGVDAERTSLMKLRQEQEALLSVLKGDFMDLAGNQKSKLKPNDPDVSTPSGMLVVDEKAQNEAFKKAQKILESNGTKAQTFIKKQLLEKLITEEQANDALLAAEIEFLEKKKALQIKYGDDYQDTEAAIIDKKLQAAKDADKKSEDERKKANDKILKNLDNKEAEELNVIKKQLADKIITEEQAQEDILLKEIEFLNQRIALKTQWGEDTAEIEGKVLDKTNKIAENALKGDEERANRLKELKREFEDEEVTKAAEKAEALAELDSLYKAGAITSEEEYQRLKTAIIEKYEGTRYEKIKKYQDAANNILGGAAEFFADLKDAELAKAGDNAEKRAEIEKKYAKKQKAIAISQAIIAGAMAVMELWAAKSVLPEPINSIYKGVMTGVIVGTTIAQIAKIKSAQFSAGGFTGDGPTHEPAGIVHKGEWIAPKNMVDSPVTGPIIAALDNMRNSKLSPAAIKTFASGGFNSSASAPGSQPSALSNSAILAKFDELKDAISKMKIYTAIEDIKKGDKKFTEIQNTRGL